VRVRVRVHVQGIRMHTRAHTNTHAQAWDARREAAATKVAAAFRGMIQRKKWAARDAERLQRDEVGRHNCIKTAAALNCLPCPESGSVLLGKCAVSRL
jgi:hypothetical protein